MTTNATTTPKITVSFDGVDSDWTATAIEGQLASGEITLDDLNPLDDTCRALLATAVETAAEEGRPFPTVCTITVDNEAGSFGIDGELRDGDTDASIRPATAAEIVQSLATAEGGILIDADGDVVQDGTWAAQQPGVRKVYVR